MKKDPKIAVLFFLLLTAGLLPVSLFAQPETFTDVNYKKFVTTVGSEDSLISLPDKFLMFGSLTVYSDSAAVSPSDYLQMNSVSAILFSVPWADI